jgi:hypothetical protein
MLYSDHDHRTDSRTVPIEGSRTVECGCCKQKWRDSVERLRFSGHFGLDFAESSLSHELISACCKCAVYAHLQYECARRCRTRRPIHAAGLFLVGHDELGNVRHLSENP